jgi:hypothetical protein
MMSFGGMERSEKQWAELLQKAGLKYIKFWRLEDSLQVVIEASLHERMLVHMDDDAIYRGRNGKI